MVVSSPLPSPTQRKWVDDPFVIGRVGGALCDSFQAAGASSKVGVSAPPLGVFVPAPRSPHPPTGQKIRPVFGDLLVRLNPFTNRCLSHVNGGEPRIG